MPAKTLKVIVSLVLISCGLAALSTVTPAQAQDPSQGWTTDLGVAVGATSFPQSSALGGVDVVGGLNPGFAATGSVGFGPAGSPLSYRVEVQYTRSGLDEANRFGPGGAPVTAHGNASVLSGIGSALLSVPLTSRLHSYLIGGAGVYRLSSSVHYTTPEGKFLRNISVPTDGRTRFGLNGGAGLEVAVGSARSFVQARFHSVFDEENANLIPVVIGVRFQL
jgi:opacity protein-like surface antigen